jgi:hypothetical protein
LQEGQICLLYPQQEQRRQTTIANQQQHEANLVFTNLCWADLSGDNLDLEADQARSLWIDNASVSVVELTADRQPLVLAIGWNPQPGWLQPSTPASEQPKSEGHMVGERVVRVYLS